MIWIILFAAIVCGMAFIRLAPTDVARWHKPIGNADSTDGKGWSARVLPSEPGLFSDLHLEMLKLPRTELIAGSVGEGRLTYITRSRIMGFPDYTTIEQTDTNIQLYARLRFGRSDLGVNGKRLDGLIERVRTERSEAARQ